MSTLKARLGLLLVCLLGAPLTARAQHAYVSNEDGRSVSVIDLESGRVEHTIEVGKRPRGIKLSEDGRTLYVALSGLPKCPPSVPDAACAKLKHDVAADGIAMVDTESLKVVRVLKAGSDPEQFDVSREGRYLYVANEDAGALSVVDTRQGTIVTRIPVGHEPEGVRLSPDGEWVSVTSETDNQVSVISAHLLQVMYVAKVGTRPRDLAYTPDGKLAFISCELDGSVYRMGFPQPNGPAPLIKLPHPLDRPMGIVLDPRRRLLYVSTGRGGNIAVIDYERRRLIAEVPVGARPWGIALTRNGRLLLSANGPSNDVSVL
ncbi:MAG TPA: beta-propeller fold lactonase family protein, partial [Steroidobacteraceae bacterium]|nr:beta-propeller fold lactonase family protein [Steroidobacteraceae bacterium]